MAINFTRLCTTLGKILGGLDEINTARYGTLNTRIDTIDARFDSAFPEDAGDLYTSRDTANRSLNGLVQYYQTLAARVLISEVTEDNPAIPETVDACLVELARQMRVSGESFQNATLTTAITSVFLKGNIGATPSDYKTSNVLVGTFDETYLRPDTVYLRPSLGSDNGATEHNEVYLLKGKEFPFNSLDARWPAGENLATSVQEIDPTVGDWFTAEATAGDWTEITVPSTASVDVRGTTTTVYQGTFTAGQTVLELEQSLGTNLRPNTWYCAYLLVQQNSSQALGFQAAIVNETSGTVFPDDEVSASGTFTVDTSTDKWQTIGVLLRTKDKLPLNPKLYITLVAGAGASRQVRACYPGFSQQKVVELYPLGPAIAVLSGNYPAVAPNLWTVTIPALDDDPDFIRGFQRLFSAASFLPQGFPVAGGPTISDNLVS